MAFRVASRVAVCLSSSRGASRVASRFAVVSFVVSWGGASVARVVWRGVGRRGCRPVCRVVVRGVGRRVCFMWKRGGRGLFSLFLCFIPPPPGRGAGLFPQVVGVFSFEMGGIFSRFSFVFDMVFDIKKPPGAVFSSGVFFVWM